ncbi:MAG: DUF2953 domain-containing protein [Candidatus Aenigmarchaeota archaeon]|nr:DUF2953 domain-containing protein [Candidatus Aenigmarchaeota archaeon]
MASLITVIVLLLFLAVLIIAYAPFRIILYGQKTGENIKLVIDFSWLSNGIILRFRILQKKYSLYLAGKEVLTKRISEKKEEKKNQKKMPRKKEKKQIPFSKDIIKPLLRFVEGLLNSFSIEKLYLKANVGFRNRATTGMLAGYFYAMNGMLSNKGLKKSVVLFQPNFDEEQFDFGAYFRASNRIANLVTPAIHFLISKPSRKIIKNRIFGR